MSKRKQWTGSLENQLFQNAILIRRVEETLLNLSNQGLLNGTVHTCIGQEFSAIAFCKQLEKDDFVFSNHRCHGHYIAHTEDYKGLIAEVMGKRSGACGGVGGSQHLYYNHKKFFSNGIQGGILPVAAGMTLSAKLQNSNRIGVVFIGDGTLGEGTVYETFNIVSKWELPLLIVLENNSYAQSTPITHNLAGDILSRPKAFGIATYEDNTSDYKTLYKNAAKSIDYVRMEGKPAFHLVNTYRLAPHSKGDDFRDPKEIEERLLKDPIHIFSRKQSKTYDIYLSEADKQIQSAVNSIQNEREQTLDEFLNEPTNATEQSTKWNPVELNLSSERIIHKINKALHYLMEHYDDVVIIGEDISDPYGGAFKATKGLSNRYPERVFSTPISESAITGIANGLALQGHRPILEIMFGDFITLTLDQIINHASKFYHMYNKQVHCPVVIRMPMGGKRGYGPTHSQSLEKFLIGIDNVKVIALNNFISPQDIYHSIYRNERNPVIVIENKIDYSRKFLNLEGYFINNYECHASDSAYKTLRFSPKSTPADITLLTYGGTNEETFQAAEILFREKEIISEIIIPTQLSPTPISDLKSAIHTDFIFTVEEGSSIGGWGGEVIASLLESGQQIKCTKRIASVAIPIPASKKLEQQALINTNDIVTMVDETFYGN